MSFYGVLCIMVNFGNCTSRTIIVCFFFQSSPKILVVPNQPTCLTDVFYSAKDDVSLVDVKQQQHSAVAVSIHASEITADICL